MIGLTLVVSMGVFASSLKASFGDVISDQTNADLFVVAVQRPGPGLQPVGHRGGASVAGVDEVSATGVGPGPLRRRRLELLRDRPGHGRRA